MPAKKPRWKKWKFWGPVILGIASSLSLLSQDVFGIMIPPEYIVSAAIGLVYILLGIDWSEHDDLR